LIKFNPPMLKVITGQFRVSLALPVYRSFFQKETEFFPSRLKNWGVEAIFQPQSSPVQRKTSVSRMKINAATPRSPTCSQRPICRGLNPAQAGFRDLVAAN
jgi:hypothetical protein